MLNGKRLKTLPLTLEKRVGCPFSLLTFNIVLEVLTRTIRQKEKKREKGI